ncbi:MAG: hypothetical protein ABI581_00055 [Sediminibacterium sp.]
MTFQNILLAVIIVLCVIALLLFLISRNKKDRKEFEADGIEDVMEETKEDHLRNKDTM